MPGLGQARAGLGRARAGPGTGRTDLEGAVQEPCRAGQRQERAQHGPCHGGGHRPVTRLGSARARTANGLAEPRASRADRAVRARAADRAIRARAADRAIRARAADRAIRARAADRAIRARAADRAIRARAADRAIRARAGDRASRAMAPTAQSEPKASRKAPDSPRQDWQTQQPGKARQRGRPCPWRAGQAPRRDRWRQQSHHPATRERAAAASTGKQQPGPPKLRHSGLIRRSSSRWPPG
jgi:hypothetical protein